MRQFTEQELIRREKAKNLEEMGIDPFGHRFDVTSDSKEIFEKYDVGTIVVGMPLNMNGTISKRAEITEEFIHKLKCKYNKIKIETVDERLTTVEAHRTMNFLDVKKNKKRNIVDTISAVYILETYLNKFKNTISKDS